MGLVTPKEIAKAIGVDKFGIFGTFSGWLLMKVLRISTANEIYNKHKHKKDLEFLNGLLDEFQIEFEIQKRQGDNCKVCYKIIFYYHTRQLSPCHFVSDLLSFRFCCHYICGCSGG